MVNQVDLKVAGLLFMPGDTFHGDVLSQLIDAAGCSPGKARLVSWDVSQDTLDGGDTDLIQLLQERWRDPQLVVGGQVAGHPNQVGGEAVGAKVVQALGDDAQSILDLWPIGATPLPLTGLALQASVHESDQALAVQFSDRLHLVQEQPLLCSGSLYVPLSHLAQVLESFVNGHFLFCGHSYLLVALSFEPIIPPR
jgi:hypothetical protein